MCVLVRAHPEEVHGDEAWSECGGVLESIGRWETGVKCRMGDGLYENEKKRKMGRDVCVFLFQLILNGKLHCFICYCYNTVITLLFYFFLVASNELRMAEGEV